MRTFRENAFSSLWPPWKYENNAPDWGFPRVFRRPIHTARALRSERCGK